MTGKPIIFISILRSEETLIKDLQQPESDRGGGLHNQEPNKNSKLLLPNFILLLFLIIGV